MSFDDEIVEDVWKKGQSAPNNDPQIWRKDVCGALIGRNYYGNRDSMYGWEIDHINPNGGDSLDNLQPLQWENNAAKGDGPLRCVVTSNGTENVRIT